MPSLEELKTKALLLSRTDRAHLAEVLIASLEEEGEISQAWRDEISRRLSEVREGSVETIPSEEVFEELDETLKSPPLPMPPPPRFVWVTHGARNPPDPEANRPREKKRD